MRAEQIVEGNEGAKFRGVAIDDRHAREAFFGHAIDAELRSSTTLAGSLSGGLFDEIGGRARGSGLFQQLIDGANQFVSGGA